MHKQQVRRLYICYNSCGKPPSQSEHCQPMYSYDTMLLAAHTSDTHGMVADMGLGGP